MTAAGASTASLAMTIIVMLSIGFVRFGQVGVCFDDSLDDCGGDATVVTMMMVMMMMVMIVLLLLLYGASLFF